MLSREQRIAPLLSGRIDAGKLRQLLGTAIHADDVDEWFLCGPHQGGDRGLGGLGGEPGDLSIEIMGVASLVPGPRDGCHAHAVVFSRRW
ncbi:hypothetical protein ABIB17_002495 [Arthrobacter sp. UYEF6]